MHAYIGLGSNLGDRRRHLEDALAGLRGHDVALRAVSSVWETEPVDAPGSPTFWNMTVEVAPDRTPLEMLDLLQDLERCAGRLPAARNAPRPLDLDLLLLGELRIDVPRLRIPHPRMWRRRFVLEPLAEIAPGARNPDSGRTVDEERRRLSDCRWVRRLGDLASCSALPV